MSALDTFFGMHRGPFKIEEDDDSIWIEDADECEVEPDHVVTLLNELWKARKP
jgi:hypothetical protein